MALTPALRALQDRRLALRATVTAAVLREWDGLGSWNRAQVDEFLAAALPLIEGGMDTEAALVAAYLERQVGQDVVLRATEDYLTGSLRGVDAETVYTRPFVTLWGGLGNGQPFAQALETARHRLDAQVQTDLQLAHRQAFVDAGRSTGLTAYRRVLNGLKSCGLCASAATRVYRLARPPAPIHGRCDCSFTLVLPGEESVVKAHNREVLKRLKAEGVSGSRKDLLNTKVVTANHGELGQVLTPQGVAVSLN